jgi:hypothetical protein
MSESKYFPAIPAANNALSSFPQVFLVFLLEDQIKN